MSETEEVINELNDVTFEIEKLDFQSPYSDSASFYFISELRVDDEGNIYVADDSRMSIRVYNSEGDSVFELGARGRGPGEFISLRGLYVDKHTKIVYVFDRYQMLITEFSDYGKKIDTYTIENVGSSITFVNIEQNKLLLYNDMNPNPLVSRLGHFFDDDFDDDFDFIPLSEVADYAPQALQLIQMNHGGVLYHHGNLYFAPYVYDGLIYEYVYNSTNREFELGTTISGISVDEAYEVLKDRQGRLPTWTVSNPGSGELDMTLVKSQSRGLFKYGDLGYHFFFKDIGKERVFGVEIFNEDWDLLGIKRIKSIEIQEGTPNTISWVVQDIDVEGNFYMRERLKSGANIIRLKLDISSIR